MASSRHEIVREAAEHCWSKKSYLMEQFRSFSSRNASAFIDAPLTPMSGELSLEMQELYQQYLRLYEETLSDYIESLSVTNQEFYSALQDVLDDSSIKDKKTLYFAQYLLACMDYPSFHKMMVRAAKKINVAEAKAESKSSEGGAKAAGSKDEGKAEDRGADSKADYK